MILKVEKAMRLFLTTLIACGAVVASSSAQETLDLPMDVRLGFADGTEWTRRFRLDVARRDVVVPLSAPPTVVEIDPRGWTPGPVRVKSVTCSGLTRWSCGAGISHPRAWS